MEKYSNFDKEMEIRNHFKNVACSKSQMNRGNFRITQLSLRLGKIAMIIIITFIASVATADAQQKTFTDAYLKLRQPKEGEEILFEKLNKKGIRKLLAAPEPKGQTEKERQEYLRGKATLKNARQISLVLDMEEQGGLISSSQISDLFSPYEELISIKMEDMRVLLSGVLTKKDKIKELIVFMSDTEDDVVFFANFLFKKPITLQDYMENPEDIRQLLSFNFHDKENDNALIKTNFSKSKTMNASPKLDITLPLRFKVVQVDGKYGVTPSPWKSKYLIEPTYEIEPVIYGSNPGNTYILTFSQDQCYLMDKFGFTIANGYEMSPVYVLENEKYVTRMYGESDVVEVTVLEGCRIILADVFEE